MRHRSQPLVFISLILFFSLLFTIFLIPTIAVDNFGPAATALSVWERIILPFKLMSSITDLIMPLDPSGSEALFEINAGEDAYKVSKRLEAAGFIADAEGFRDYLVWKGYDTTLQVGIYRLSPAFNAITIADILTHANLAEVHFSILPGWRLEEIANSLPSSGLAIDKADFLDAASTGSLYLDDIPEGNTVEGFLYPDVYILPRSISAYDMVVIFINRFISNCPEDYHAAYSSRGLSLYEGVIMASIIEREAVRDEEMPMIASVFYNRLAAGMKLQMDSTVQYAIGYVPDLNTWWTTRLTQTDLQFSSPYNTYIHLGLPPGPISNPGVNALRAVAYPTDSPFFYFQAKCDGSGFHNFSSTYEEHLLNNCP